MALCVTIAGLVTTVCSSRQSQSARSAIRRYASPGDWMSTVGAGYAFCTTFLNRFAIVPNDMTRRTYCNSITKFICQLRMLRPRFNVMSMKMFSGSAILTGIFISLDNHSSPSAVICTAPIDRAIHFARCSIATFFAAIFSFASLALSKFNSTSLTHQCGSNPGLSPALFTGTNLIAEVVCKFLPTYSTGICATCGAMSLPWGCNYELLSTCFTNPLGRECARKMWWM